MGTEIRFLQLSTNGWSRLCLLIIIVALNLTISACSNSSDTASNEQACDNGTGCELSTHPAINNTDEQSDVEQIEDESSSGSSHSNVHNNDDSHSVSQDSEDDDGKEDDDDVEHGHGHGHGHHGHGHHGHEHHQNCDSGSSYETAGDPDLNNDGCVTGKDVKIVAVCLGKKGANNPNCQFELADTNADGHVGLEDLWFVVKNKGICGFPVGGNNVPVADAGENRSAEIGDMIKLDGSSSSDLDGDSLSYAWSLEGPTGSTAFMSDNTAVDPQFLIDIAGTFTVELIVNDGSEDSFPATISISTFNSPPLADAGPDQTASVFDTILLDGSGSTDMDGDSLSFSWLLSPPAGSIATLSDPLALNPGFEVDLPGTYIALLIVNDGIVDSVPDNIIVDTENSRPVANAGLDQAAAAGEWVILNGAASSDVDGDTLTFSWSIKSQPAASIATLANSSTANSALTVDMPGNYVLELRVNDGFISSTPDSVSISTLNSMPVAQAGLDQTAFVGNTVTLDGSASIDANADPLTYNWSLTLIPENSTATLSDTSTIMPSFVIDTTGYYVAQLIVSDGFIASDPDTVVISTGNLAPVADAGQDQVVLPGETVSLDGSGSGDADGDPLTYSWAFTSIPVGSTEQLIRSNTPTPDFIADRAGNYIIQLIVDDGLSSSVADTVVVTARDTQSPTRCLSYAIRMVSSYRMAVSPLVPGLFSMDHVRSILVATWCGISGKWWRVVTG